MNIKYFPPVGTRPTDKTVDSQEANSTAANAQNTKIASKDVFDQFKSSTIDYLIANSKAKDPMKQAVQQSEAIKEKQLEPTADCDPVIRTAGKKKIEPAANCITFRVEIAGSCIPMKKLEPVGSCDPATRTLHELKQQQQVATEKKLTGK